MSLDVGAQIGEYRILSRIGGGAFGEVFDAEHVITRRRDAIKVLVDGRLHIPEEEERFLREIQVQASLHHPNLAAVYNAFPTPHGLALVMELVRGEPLNAILERGRIPLRLGIGLVLEMLEGLSYAHTHGVVHRDIKPENVIIAHDGSVKLTDFGLAKALGSPSLSQSGTFHGSPSYMSPEQGLGDGGVDARSDTYSAGVMLYEIVTGRLPFMGESAFAVMSEHQNSSPPPPVELNPAISQELNSVILKSLEKHPERRFQTAAAFHTALEQAAAVDAEPRVGAAAVRARSSAWQPTRRILMVGGICVALSAATYSVVRHRHTVQAAFQIQPAPQIQAPQPAVEIQPAPPAPEAIAPPAVRSPAPPLSAEPAGAPVAVSPIPPTPPPARQSGSVRKSLPPAPQALRITGSVPDEPAPPPRSKARPVEHGPAPTPEAPRSPVSEAPASSTASAPETATPATSVTPGKSTAEAPEAKADPGNGSTVKRRNVVVRTLQRVFHPHPKTGNSESEPQTGGDKGPGKQL